MEVKRFCDVLTDGSSSQLRLYSTDSAPKDEMKIPEGTDRRAQIDSLITFASDRLPEEKMTELLLRLGELMYYLGEMEISTDMSEEVLSRTNKKEELESVRAEANLQMARLKWSQGYWDESKSYARKAHKIYTKNNDVTGFAKYENLLGTIYGEKGDLKKAMLHFEKGLAILGNSENKEIRAMLEMNLGVIHTMQNNFETAEDELKNSLDHYHELEDKRSMARALHNLGQLHTSMGNYENAMSDFDNCLSISTEQGYLSNCTISYLGKAHIFAKNGNYQQAEFNADMAMELAYKLNDTLTIADAYKVKGMIYKHKSDIDLAEEFLESSLRLNKDFGNDYNYSESSGELRELYLETGRIGEAELYERYLNGYERRTMCAV